MTTPLLEYFEFIGFDLYDWTLVFALGFLLLEILDDVLESRLDGRRLGETLSNLLTQIPYYLAELLVFGVYVTAAFVIYEYIPWKLPVTPLVAIATLFISDFIYYVEHYCGHKVRLLWLAHSVHHSSPIMNISTAFRFSFFDPFVSALFHLPLVFLGFHPILIFMSEVIVQAYQFWIHNEMIGKLGPLEWVLNTPSHHRVHHGSDNKYLDKNFGGILIIFDRLFGTFQAEEELPTYGLTTPINTVNPVKVQLYEFPRLLHDLRRARRWQDKLGYLLRSPGWQAKSSVLSPAEERPQEAGT